MSFLWYVTSFLLALGILIVVHEMGHFLMAKWCGVKVLRFSMGFGKPLITRQWGVDKTEWTVSAFPLGGYIKMLDEREAPVPAEVLHRAFNRQSVWKRIAIVAAGPLANLFLAVFIYFAIFLTGVSDLKPQLALPNEGSMAANSGFQNGETINSIDGQVIQTWSELRKQLLQAAIDHRRVKLVTTGIDAALTTRTLDLSAQQLDDLGTDPAGKLGLKPFMPRMDAIVGSVSPNSPAQTAGLKTDDLIVAIDDMPVSEWAQVVARIRPAYGKSLKLEIIRGPRGGEETSLVFNIVPAQATENGELVGRLGIAVKPDPSSLKAMTVRIVRGPVEALKSALDEVCYTSALTLRMIGRMIVGELSLKNLSGPVSIAEYAGQSAHMGLSPYLVFIALISISLGVLNLLPIPVLDGGHLMYYLAELFKGSPVSDRVAEVGQKIGVGALGLLMLFALYNDFHRLISG